MALRREGARAVPSAQQTHIGAANSIKPTTANVEDGEAVHEIMVLGVWLKDERQPLRTIEAIAAANPHKLVFCTEPIGMAYVLRGGLQVCAAVETLALAGRTLDAVWDSIGAQVVFGDENGANLDERIDMDKRRAVFEAEIARLDATCRKAKQINRKNELFAQKQILQRKRDALG